MFGRDSDNSADSNDQSHLAPTTDAAATAADTAAPAGDPGSTVTPTAPVTDGASGLDLPEPSGTTPAGSDASATSAPVTDSAAAGDMPADYIMTDGPDSTPADTTPADTPSVAPPAMPSPSSSAAASPLTGDLGSIKQQALQQLSPLVSHLDLSPEDKFRTTMMMLQATDDQGLIKDAYAAAQAIPDEKTRAQALLDVVNEINYFTQQATSNQS